VTPLILNIVFGLIPTLTLGWSMAADERKPAADRVVSTSSDRRQQSTMFLLVYGLWALTLAMWNWMRGYQPAWIAVWAVAGVVGLVWYGARKRR
jgi:hypothetical protein